MIARTRILRLMILVLLSVALSGCHKDTDQEKIAKMLHLIQAEAEDKNAGALLKHVSKNYRDPRGNDYEAVKGLLLFYFFRHQRISIITTGLEIEIQGASARARFEAILSGRSGSNGAILPEALDAYRFAVSLTNEGGEWEVTSAQWSQFGADSPELRHKLTSTGQ